jgi:hypothetical protein
MPPASKFTPLMGLQQAAVAPPPPTADPKDTDPNDPDYEGPEDGPFECSNCTYYQDPNVCSQPAVVASQGGVVDPAGCCKFFTSAHSQSSEGSDNS